MWIRQNSLIYYIVNDFAGQVLKESGYLLIFTVYVCVYKWNVDKLWLIYHQFSHFGYFPFKLQFMNWARQILRGNADGPIRLDLQRYEAVLNASRVLLNHLEGAGRGEINYLAQQTVASSLCRGLHRGFTWIIPQLSTCLFAFPFDPLGFRDKLIAGDKNTLYFTVFSCRALLRGFIINS